MMRCKKCGKNKLSIIAALLLFFKIFVVFFLFGNLADTNKIVNFICEIPWILISLVLAIFGRCLYKDTLSLFVIIVDIILIIFL